MMEGVKNLVKTRVEQEEEDARVVEQRVEEIMELDPGSIATFLQSIPTKSVRNSTLDSSKNSNSDSNLGSDSDDNSGSDSDSDSDSDTESGSDSESSSSESSSLLPGREEKGKEDPFGRSASNFTMTTKSKSFSLSPNNSDDDSRSFSSDNDNDSASCSSSSSSSSSSPEDRLIPSQSHDEESERNKNSRGIDDLDLSPPTVIIQPVHEIMSPTTLKHPSGAAITSESSKSIGNQTNQLLDDDQTSDIGSRSYLQFNNRRLAKNRFRQGVLAVIAMDRLKMIVKRDAPPSSPMHTMASPSARLVEMYMPSDDEWSDESDSDNDSCEDTSECPVCLDLIDPTHERKIIVLREMLCEECYFLHYINRGDKYGNNDQKMKSSKRTSEKGKHQNNDDKLDFNTTRDVQLLNSLKRCISSTNKSPMLPVLPMPNQRDHIYVNMEEKSGQTATAATLLRRKKESTQRKSWW
jgi:hypothetical protein